MKFCTFCGSYMDDAQTVCPSCHTPENSSLQQDQSYMPSFSQAGADSAVPSRRNPEICDLETSFQPMDAFNSPGGSKESAGYEEPFSETAVIQPAEAVPEVLSFQKYPRPYSTVREQKNVRAEGLNKGFSIFCHVMAILYSVFLILSVINFFDYMANNLFEAIYISCFAIALIMTFMQIIGFCLSHNGSRKGAVLLLLAALATLAAEFGMGYSMGGESVKTGLHFVREDLLENGVSLLTAAVILTGLVRQTEKSEKTRQY